MVASDSLKIAGISLGNYFLSLSTLSVALQCVVAIMSIIYLSYKIKRIRNE